MIDPVDKDLQDHLAKKVLEDEKQEWIDNETYEVASAMIRGGYTYRGNQYDVNDVIESIYNHNEDRELKDALEAVIGLDEGLQDLLLAHAKKIAAEIVETPSFLQEKAI